VAFIPEIVFQLRDKTLTFITQLLQGANQGGFSEGMYFSVTCNEEAPFTTREAIAAALESVPADLRPYFLGPDPLGVCAVWGGAPPSPAAHQAVTSALPTLLLSGEIDPVTPPAWSALAKETLAKGERFDLKGLGHAVANHPCGATLVTEFLAKPDARPPSTCADQLMPRPFMVLRF
jgi:hypothetical protein